MESNTISEFAHLKMPLEDIVKATNNFADENIIGKGGFGTVYKGEIRFPSDWIWSDISCRRLDRRHGQGDVEFWTEISVLSNLDHENIVKIIGYCDEKNEKIIITDYFPNGSLSMHLSDTTNLTWNKRLEKLKFNRYDNKQELGDSVGRDSPNSWKVKGLGHLRIRLTNKLSAADNFSKRNMFGKKKLALLDAGGHESPNPWKVKGRGHLRIRLIDVLRATQNFSRECLLGEREWGFEYVAELKCFDRENTSSIKKIFKITKRCYKVRIKKFKKSEPSFDTEIEILSSCKHRNIESLLGFCDEGPDMILVYEFFPGFPIENQSLPFTWEKRLKMCLEIAHGLNYIHNDMQDQKTVIHRAISGDNIYFDNNKGVKITGFRESLFLPPNQADDTLYIENKYPYFNPYLDPEYVGTGKLKRESDIYSFGAVMFQILCGKPARNLAFDGQKIEMLSQVAQRWFDTRILKKVIDPVLMAENGENRFYLKGPNEDSLEAFSKIAYRCLAETQNERPTIKVIIKELEKALSFQENNKDTFRMSLEEIKSATDNFSPDNEIGGGGFGRVYKGKVAHRHGSGHYSIVAKRLDTSHGQGEQQYYNELQILYEYKHENVIGLVGYSNETDEKVIVYEHACKGSLDKCLNDASLTWRNRLKICIDFATGLSFIHGGVDGKEVVIHRDIKAANILLFDDWMTKIGDFGLSIISTVNEQTDYVIDHVCGTPGYCDPLYLKSGFLTIESDIYSLGVVLFEILCGRSTFEIRKYEGRYLPDFVKHKFDEGKQNEVVFEALKKEIVPKSLTTFQNIAYQCLDDNREKRPRAKQVLAELKKTLEFQEDENIGAEPS